MCHLSFKLASDPDHPRTRFAPTAMKIRTTLKNEFPAEFLAYLKENGTVVSTT
jgi:hypothetical protein